MTPSYPHPLTPTLRRAMVALFLCCTFLLFSSMTAQAASISGTVTDNDGVPLETVTVQLYKYSTEYSEWQSTFFAYTVNGNYRIDGFPAGTYRLGFSRPYSHRPEYYNNQLTVQSASDIVIVSDGTQLTGYDAILSDNGLIVGKVVDPDGNPIADSNISLWVDYGEGYRAIEGASTNGNGEFAFSVLSDHPHKLGANYQHVDYVDEYYDNKPSLDDADPFMVLADQVMTVTIELSRTKSIRGTVTDIQGNHPLVQFNLYQLQENDEWTRVYIDSYAVWEPSWDAVDKTYRIPGLAPGKYRLKFTGDEIISEFYNDQDDIENADIIDLTGPADFFVADAIVAKRGIITGTVTDRNGSPIRNADVYLYVHNGTEWEFEGGVLTNARGNYTHYQTSPDQEYRIRFEARNYHVAEYYNNSETITAAQSITIPADATIPNINAQLDSFGGITGTVTGAQGEPLANVLVNSYLHPGGDYQNYAFTDSNGRYQLTLAPGQEYSIGFSHATHEAEFYDNKTSIATGTIVTAAINTIVPNINAQLSLGPVISGKVTGNNGRELSEIEVSIFDDDGSLKASTYTNAQGNYAVSVPSGTYRIGFNVHNPYETEGDYAGEYHPDAATLRDATPIVLSIGNDLVVNAEIAVIPSISGYVSFSNGKYAENAYVSLYKRTVSNGKPEWERCCDRSTYTHNGYYRFPTVEPGEYTIQFSTYMDGGYEAEFYDNQYKIESATILTVTDRTHFTNINGVLDRVGKLIINVVDEDNNPLPNINIVAYSQMYMNGKDFNEPLPSQTDQNGQGIISPNIITGSWLEFTDPSYKMAGEYYDNKPNIVDARPITVSVGSTKTITVTLSPAASLAGRITDSSGQPIPNVLVNLFSYWSPYAAKWRTVMSHIYSDENGYYQIDGLTPGRRYRMSVISLEQQYFYPNPYPIVHWDINQYGQDIIIPSAVGLSNVDIVLLQPGEVMAAFSGTPREGVGSLGVNFTDASLGNVTGYSWDFGDGTGSTEKNPSHIYQPGTYTVKLTVNGSGASDSETKVGYIVVNESEITEVGMAQGTRSSGNSQSKVGETLYFSATATGSNVIYNWDFGDGEVSSASTTPSASTSTATGQYVQHVYSAPGDYTVTLIARNGVNEKVTTQQISIGSAGSGDMPVSALAVDAPSKALVGQVVNLVASAGGGGNVTYSWDFGDGNSGTGANVSHSYTEAGTYTIKVTASNGAGSVEHEVQLIVDYGLHIPKLGR